VSKGKAFLVVGHKNWGKSTTLKALTGGKRPRRWEIESIVFFIRRMSNDDYPKDFLKLVIKFDSDDKPYVIAALCPTFTDEKKLPVIRAILDALKRKYKLFFFVLQHKCKNPKRIITEDEIDKLERYGTVKVFHPERARPKVIADAFQTFVMKYA